MAHATDDVKAICRHVAPSNAEDGVMQVLRREFPFLND
jgi:hydroxymethylpyrimidine pyrophosphatase-like HAD family hydrolase